LVSIGRIAIVGVLATFGLAGPASAKTFGTNLVTLVGHVDTFNADTSKIIPIADKLLYYADHLPALLAEVDSVGAAAQTEVSTDERQATTLRHITAAAKDYSAHGNDTLNAVATGNQALFVAAVQRMSPSATVLDSALDDYRVPYQDLLVDDPLWKVTLAVGIVLAVVLVAHLLTWLFGRRSTLMDRERRRSRARLTGRAVLASLMNGAGAQLYRVPGAATSVGVRAGMAAVSVASLAFYLIGKTQQHMLVRNLKREGIVPDKVVAVETKRPNWAPEENSVTQYIIPVGDIAPISRPNDGVLLLGDFLRTGDEEAPTWHVESSLVAAAVTGGTVRSVSAAATPAPVRYGDPPAGPSFPPAMTPTGRPMPPPPPGVNDEAPVRIAVPAAMRSGMPPPPPPPMAAPPAAAPALAATPTAATPMAAPPMAAPPMSAPAMAPGLPAPGPTPAAAPVPAPIAVIPGPGSPGGGPPPPPPLPRRRSQTPSA
jgi:hypothetical protein